PNALRRLYHLYAGVPRPSMDFLCNQCHFLARGCREASCQMSDDAVRRFHYGRPTGRPVLYLLEIAAALVSVLALRDVVLHNALPSIEALSAAALWIAFFVSVYCRVRKN